MRLANRSAATGGAFARHGERSVAVGEPQMLLARAPAGSSGLISHAACRSSAVGIEFSPMEIGHILGKIAVHSSRIRAKTAACNQPHIQRSRLA
jgi:hypothetical protein